jgi:hypothetical protein
MIVVRRCYYTIDTVTMVSTNGWTECRHQSHFLANVKLREGVRSRRNWVKTRSKNKIFKTFRSKRL